MLIIFGVLIIAAVAGLFLTAAQGPMGNGGRLAAAVAMATFWSLIGMGLIGMGLGGSFWYAALSGLILPLFLFVAINSPALQKGIGATIVLAFVGSVLVGFGIIPLNVRNGFSNWRTGVASNIAGDLNQRALKSVGSVGLLDYTKQGGVVFASPNGTVYSVAGREVNIPANQQVRIMTPNGSPVSQNGMTQVMLRDSNGDFISGVVVWIPNGRLKSQTFSATKSLKGAFGGEVVSWEGVAEQSASLNQPWQTVFTGVPAGEYRVVATGEREQLFRSRDGRTLLHRRVRPNGEILNDAGQWSKHRAGPDCPVPGADFVSLIYRVGGMTPRSYRTTFMVGEGRTADVQVSSDIPHDSRSFSGNRGAWVVRLERKVTS